ncbi:MAG: hypothetical protein FJX72_03325 [Armatimonadetes bacterium]|nr:hypothetical protein [Armatimonadota bacterium]
MARRVPSNLAIVGWLCIAALSCLPARLDAADAKRRTTVILCEGLHAPAMRDPARPALRALAARGAVGLLAVSAVAARSRESAFLSLAVGAPVRGEEGDAAIYGASEIVEGCSAADVLVRRTGKTAIGADPRFADAIVHIGIARLIRAGIAEDLIGASSGAAGRIGTDIPAHASPARRIAGLLAVGADGVGSGPHAPDVEIVATSVGDDRGLLERHIAAASGNGDRVWVLSPLPSPQGIADYAVRPTLTVLAGSGMDRGLLTSRTTRTPGLISVSDVAATIRVWLGSSEANAGNVIEVRSDPASVRTIEALDRVATTNVRAATPVLMLFGAFIGIVAGLGLAMLRMRPALAPLATMLCVGAMPFPVALMVAGRVVRQSPIPLEPAALAAVIAGACAVIAAAVAVIVRLTGRDVVRSTMVALMALTVAATVADGVGGQAWVRASLLSAPGMSGTRFYGIGNEHMGFLVASGLGVVFLGGLRPAWALAIGCAITATLGLGTVGANAGGVVTSVASFGTAWSLLRGRSVSAWRAAAWIALGLVAAGVFAWLDGAVAGPGASHLGAAAIQARTGGWEVLRALAGRKLAMNLGAVASGYGVFAWAAALGLGVATFTMFRREIEAVAARHPEWWRWRGPAAVGAAAAFVSNDTGLVPALIIGGSFVLLGLALRFARPRDPLLGGPGSDMPCDARAAAPGPEAAGGSGRLVE